MTAAREAIYLPLMFLAVTLLGGMRLGAPAAGNAITFVPPPLFSLVLAIIVVGVLVRSGALAPERLMNGARSPLANLNGMVVLLTAFVATAQAFNLATPASGLPLLVVDTLLLVLLINTLVAAPDRVRVLRSFMVIFGVAFVLKFVVLASLSDPSGGRMKKVLQLLLEGITLGTLTQEPIEPASGYIAFGTLLLYLIAVALLPPQRPHTYTETQSLRERPDVGHTGSNSEARLNPGRSLER
jgi:hypothetical protein